MAREKGTEPDLDMLAAALLMSEGRTQVQIANILGVSQAAVSRYLAEARNKYLREEIRFLENKLDSATLLRIRQRADRSSLCEMLSKAAQRYTKGPGPIVRVFPSGSASADWDTRLAIFARNAAPYLRQLILRTRYCGLTWGKTVWSLVQACKDLAVPAPWSADGIEVVPLNGEPLGDLPNSFSSSTLCDQLGKAINGLHYRARSLSMVPAFVPDGFTEERRAGVEDLIDLVESYREIFGSLRSRRAGTAASGLRKVPSETPLVKRLDMILTSVSPSEHPLGHGSGRLAETGNLDINELRRYLLGDVGGVCVGRDNLRMGDRNRGRDLVDKINGRWTGIHRDDMESIVREARDGDRATGKPGLVIAAISSNKSHVLYDIAIKLGLANILLVDEDCEQELARIVKQDFNKV